MTDMYTYEELRSMTQEDLVRLALEHQEQISLIQKKLDETMQALINTKELLKNLFKY